MAADDWRPFLEQLQARANLVALVERRVPLKRQGRNYIGLCPFHNEKTPSFSVNAERGFYHCFGCGAHGDAISFLRFLQPHLSFVEAVRQLAEDNGMTPPASSGRGDGGGARKIFEEMMGAAAAHFRRELARSKTAAAYLKKRGVSEAAAEIFQIGYGGDGWDGLRRALERKHKTEPMLRAGLLRKKEGGGKDSIYDFFRRRLMFPIHSERGATLGFGGRAMDDEHQPKYINSPESPFFSKRYVIYGLWQAAEAARAENRIVVVEGYMDVVGLWCAGVKNAVAVMGTAATAAQMEKLLRYADNVVFAFDGDSAGQRAAARAMENILPGLSDGKSVSFLFLPEGSDPDDYVRQNGAAAFARLLDNADSLGGFMAAHLRRQAAQQKSEEGRHSAMARGAQELLKKINPKRAAYLREILQKKLADAGGVSTKTLGRGTDAARSAEQTRAAAPRDEDLARFRARESEPLFKLLCLAAADSNLARRVEEENIPTPTASPLLAEAVKKLARRAAAGDGENGGAAAFLAAAGYVQLARQVAGHLPLYARIDAAAEFAPLVDSLRRKSTKRAAGKG